MVLSGRQPLPKSMDLDWFGLVWAWLLCALPCQPCGGQAKARERGATWHEEASGSGLPPCMCQEQLQ